MWMYGFTLLSVVWEPTLVGHTLPYYYVLLVQPYRAVIRNPNKVFMQLQIYAIGACYNLSEVN